MSRRWIVALLVPLCFSSAWAQGRDEGEERPPPSPEAGPQQPASAFLKPTATVADIERAWARARAALEANDAAAAARELDAIEAMRLDLGIESMPTHAVALLRQARRALEKDNPVRAIELCRRAERLAPRLAEASFIRASAYFSESALALGRVAGALYEGASRFLESPRHRDALLVNLLIVIGLALLCAVLVFLLLQLVRHAPRLHHVVCDFTGVGKVASAVLLAIVLALPLLLGLGPLGLVFLWSAAFWLNQSRAERIVSLVALAAVAAAPLLVSAMTPRFVLQTQVATDLDELATGLPSAEVVERAEARLARNPDEIEHLFLLARLHKSRGDDAKAEAYYRHAVALRPDDAPLLNNYANFLLVTGRVDEAIRLYEHAIRVAPALAALHYNLSQAHRQQVEKVGSESLQKHTTALQSAQRLDARLVQELQRRQSRNRNRYVVDLPLPAQAVRARARRSLGEEEVLRAQIWERVAEWLPVGSAPWVSLGFMALLGTAWLATRRLRFPFPCARCGATVCARCHPELASGDLCIQCHHIYLRATALDPKLRLEKEAQIHRHHTRRRRIRVALSAIVMGAGQVLAARPARGIALLALFFFLVFEATFWNGIVRYPAESEASPSTLRMVLLGIAFLPPYLLGLAGVLRK